MVFIDVYLISKLSSGVNIIVIFNDLSTNYTQGGCDVIKNYLHWVMCEGGCECIFTLILGGFRGVGG